jgi:hypothetical protein
MLIHHVYDQSNKFSEQSNVELALSDDPNFICLMLPRNVERLMHTRAASGREVHRLGSFGEDTATRLFVIG